MPITGKQVETAVAVTKLVLGSYGASGSVTRITQCAPKVATLFTDDPKEQKVLANSIVDKMVTIRAEIV